MPASDSARPPAPPLDDRMRRYMRARAVRRRVSDGLSALVRLLYPGRLDRRRHAIIIPETSFSPWRSDRAFRETYRRIEDFSLVDEMRLYELWRLAHELASIPGDILEVGVWRGGSGCLIATQSEWSDSKARVYLCDTFSGVVKAGADDPIYSGGEHGDTSPELVRSLVRHLGLENVEILVGEFPDESAPVIADREFKLCHLMWMSMSLRRRPRSGSGRDSSKVASSSSMTTAATEWTEYGGQSTSSPPRTRAG
jgi:Macrocin-O-methyltransferase (TylF)